MRYAAILHPKRYFSESKFIIDEQFLYSFDLVGDIESFNGNSEMFRKEIGHVSVVIPQFLT